MKIADSAPRPSSINQKSVEATRHAVPLALLEQLAEHRHDADESAASATRARTRLGIWNAIVNALIRPAAPNIAGHHFADEPEHTEEPGGDGEDGRRSAEPGGGASPGAALDRSMRTRGSSCRSPGDVTGPRTRPHVWAFLRDAVLEEQKERSRSQRGTPRDPLIPLDDQDAHEASRDRRRRRRRRGGRVRAPRARQADRPRGCPWRAAPERGRAQEVAGRQARVRRQRLAHAARGTRDLDERELELSSFASREPPFRA